MALERKKITVPADGVTQQFSLAGFAVVVESVGTFSGPEQVPLIRFQDQQNIAQPIYPQSVLIAVNGLEFRRFFITGTSESAGDIIYLLISDVCMNQSLSPETFQAREVQTAPAFTKAANDTVQSLSDLEIQNSDGTLATKIYVAARDGDIIYSIESDPVQGTAGLGVVLKSTDPVQPIAGIKFIQGFRFIAAVLGETPDLTIILEY